MLKRRMSLGVVLPLFFCSVGCGKETALPRPEKKVQSAPAKPAKETTAPIEDPPTKKTAPIPDDMLGVPGGVFEMGLNDKGIPDERPAHLVTVAPFLLDRTEVTNQAYNRCVEAKKCRRPAHLDTAKSGFEPLEVFRRSNHPVTGVSHDDAEAYCAFVGKRLPREAEWERAARGKDKRLFPWGDGFPTPELAVFRAKVTKPVGGLPKGKGPYGHLDLAGNVWEWVEDHYDPYAYIRQTASKGVPGDCKQILAALRELKRQGKQGFTGTNPIPDECEFVLRGGAFNYFPWGLRSTNRVHHAGRFRIAMAGFRCARDWPDGPAETQ
jgi:formylglycine-generating enzyme required for sulfatase activity